MIKKKILFVAIIFLNLILLYSENKVNFDELIHTPKKFKIYLNSVKKIKFYNDKKTNELSQFINFIYQKQLNQVFSKETNALIQEFKRINNSKFSPFLNVEGVPFLKKDKYKRIYIFYHRKVSKSIITEIENKILNLEKTFPKLFRTIEKKNIYLVIASPKKIPYSPFLIKKRLKPQIIKKEALRVLLSQILNLDLTTFEYSPLELGTLNFLINFPYHKTYNPEKIIIGTNLSLKLKDFINKNFFSQKLFTYATFWENFLDSEYQKIEKNKFENLFLSLEEIRNKREKINKLLFSFCQREKQEFLNKNIPLIQHINGITLQIYNIHLLKDLRIIPALNYFVFKKLKEQYFPQLPSQFKVKITNNLKDNSLYQIKNKTLEINISKLKN